MDSYAAPSEDLLNLCARDWCLEWQMIEGLGFWRGDSVKVLCPRYKPEVSDLC